MDKILNAVRRILNSKSLKYGSNSAILIVGVIAVAVVINLLVNTASLKLDLTPNKLYSLSNTTKEILKGANKDVSIYGLFDFGETGASSDLKEVTGLLDKYSRYPHMSVRYMDPDKKPGLLKELDPDNARKIAKGDIIVKCGNKIKKLTYADIFTSQFDQQTLQRVRTGSNAENAITGAVKYVLADKSPAVYFITGHEERDPDTDYTIVKDYLDRNNYEVKKVNLSTVDKVPDDAEILVVASPKRDLTSDESLRLQEYLQNGGKCVFLFDPLETGMKFPKFEDMLQKYNIALNYDKVKENDSNRHAPNKPYDIMPDVLPSEINAALNPGGFFMAMPNSGSLRILRNQKEYITTTTLVKSSGKAVGEQMDKSAGGDNPGPLDLAVAVEYKGGAKPAKLLVIGNGFFMTDKAIGQYQQLSMNGLYFFLNSLQWMQDRTGETLIEPKSYDMQRLSMTAAQVYFMAFLVLILLPLLILGAGTFVWMRRRHL